MRKPKWVVEKERAERDASRQTIWLYGLHAVREALRNRAREKLRLVVTRNAADRLGDALAAGPEPEIVEPRRFSAPLDPGSVHQGAALEVRPLHWGDLADLAAVGTEEAPLLLLLDRVSDPQNVGAILRSAEVFGARGVVAPVRHAAPETGALAKAASGALERLPYLRVGNLGQTMERLQGLGYALVGLDGAAERPLVEALGPGPLGLVLGAEGPGLRSRTRSLCDCLAKIPSARDFASLNVSNAAAVALFAASLRGG